MINSIFVNYVCSNCKYVFPAKYTRIEGDDRYEEETTIHMRKKDVFDEWSLRHEAKWTNFICPKCVENGSGVAVVAHK